MLGEDERRAAENGLDVLEEAVNVKKKREMSPKERRSLVLLTLLCKSILTGVKDRRSH